MDDTALEQFIQMADRYSAFTEVIDSTQKHRNKLFSTLVTIWIQLTPLQKEQAREYIVQLNRESKLTLPQEEIFSKLFQAAVIKQSNLARSRR